MTVFDNFPYTNFHELNLDWIISQVKKYSDKVDSIDTELRQEIDEAIDFMKNNIEQTTADIINQYVAEGVFNIGLRYNPDNEELNIIITK